MSSNKQNIRDVNIFVKYCSYIWLIIPFLFTAWLAKMHLPDSDAWFLTATGRYIVETGSIPTINPFIIHNDFGIIVQQWLVDVLNYFVYDKFGNTGMFVWAILFLLITNILLYKYLGYFTNNVKLRSFILTVCSVVLFSFANTRPTSISLPILLAELIILEKYNSNKKSNSIWLIPLLSILLINCHSALWLFIIVLMMPYLVPGLNKFRSIKEIVEHLKEYKKLWLVVIPTLLAGFINPNGLKGILYIYYSYSEASSSNLISELKAASVDEFIGAYVIASAIIIALYIYKFKLNISWKNLYLALGTYILAAKHSRNIWFLILGVTPLIVAVFSEYVSDTIKIKYKDNEYKLLSVVYTVAIITLFTILNPAIPYEEEDTNFVPTSAVEYLNELPESKKDNIVLFTGFNNGAYLEWNGYKVYMDARPELFQSKIGGKEDIYSEYMDIYKGVADFDALIEKYNFTHIIVDKEIGFKNYLKYTDNYEVVLEVEDQYTLFERKDF